MKVSLLSISTFVVSMGLCYSCCGDIHLFRVILWGLDFLLGTKSKAP